MLPRIAELSSLTEDDTDTIIHPVLRWYRVWTDGCRYLQGKLMFDDIDLLVMLQLVARVVADSLEIFASHPYQHDAEPATGPTV